MKNIRSWITFGALAFGVLARPSLYSQEPAAAAEDTTPARSPEEVVVSGVAVLDRTSPLERPISSIYGMDLGILDTPRSVTSINAAQQRDLSIRQVTDFSKIVSSSFTLSQFGGANIPYLRGQTSEVFQNGMLRTPRSDGQPLSFNSVEAFDVVKGPASVVYGPTGNVGGYVNLNTKRPYLDGYHGSVTATYGQYDLYRWQADVGGPISKELAWRLSYEGEDSRSYYRFQATQSQDVYLALSWTPSSKFRIDFNTEFFEADYFENTGWNRPTQDLIDNDRYITGVGRSLFAAPNAADPRGFLSVITPTGTVKLDRSVGLVAPTDGDYGKNYQAQLEATYTMSDNVSLVNKSYFELYEQDQLEFAQRYFNRIEESYNFENRTELHLNFDTPLGSKSVAPSGKDAKDAKTVASTEPALVLKNQVNTGLAFRWVHTLAYGDFYNEYLNATDLTTDPRAFPITQLFGVVPLPNDPNQSATPGGAYGSPLYPNTQPGTLEQDAYQVGLFYQHNVKITEQLNFLFGGRGDLIYEEANDPLPPPGFEAVSDSTLNGLGAGNASISFKPKPWNTEYFTFNFNQSATTSNGGGFASLSNNTLSPNDFHIQNFLYEGGSKFGLLNNTLYVSLAAYYQQRSVTNQFNVTAEVVTRGLELEANYQPNKNFYGTFSISYLDAFLPDAAPGRSTTRSVYDAFAPPTGTGVGSPNFGAASINAEKTYRLGGLPHLLINAFGKYRLDCGIGGSLGVVATSPIPLTEFGDVVIPWQYTVDAALFYETPRFEARVDFANITDERNFTPGNSFFGADLVNPNLPFHVQGSVRIRF